MPFGMQLLASLASRSLVALGATATLLKEVGAGFRLLRHKAFARVPCAPPLQPTWRSPRSWSNHHDDSPNVGKDRPAAPPPFRRCGHMTIAAAQFEPCVSANSQPGERSQLELPGGSSRAQHLVCPAEADRAAFSTSDMPKPARPRSRRSFFCTAGPTTFTALSMSRRCWRRPATG